MLLSQSLMSKLETDRPWLRHQVPFEAGWEQGCSEVAQILDVWTNEYAQELNLKEPMGESIKQACFVRIWSAWAYHWEQAADRSYTKQADGMAVASDVKAGIRTGYPHSMGGDPLRDTVLVETCLAGLSPALKLFHTEYRTIFEQEIRRTYCREPNVDLWEDLFVKLVGSTRGDGKLNDFKGYTSLRAWLRPVARNFALDRWRSEQIRHVAERRAALLHKTEITDTDALELEETIVWSRTQVAQAIASLNDRDRLLLILRYRAGWPGNAIADLLKVHPGHFSRLLSQATERFRIQLESPWEQLFQEYNSQTVAYLLFRGLSDVRPLKEFEAAANASRLAKEPFVSPTKQKLKKAAPKKKSNKPSKKKTNFTLPSGLVLNKFGNRADRNKTSKTTKSQARQKVVVEGSQPMTRVDLQELTSFLPERMFTAKISQSPETIFKSLNDKASKNRPAVICLDFRRMQNPGDVSDWLDRFYSIVAEQYKDLNKDPFWLCLAVVVHTNTLELSPELKKRVDLDWIRTDDMKSPIESLYNNHLLSGLSELVNDTLDEFFPAIPAGETEDLLTLMSPSKREAWKERVQEIMNREDEP